MKQPKFPITHHDLAKVSKLPIKAKILIDNLEKFKLRTNAFLDYLTPLFSLLIDGKPSFAYFTSTKRSNKFFYSRHFDFEEIPDFFAPLDNYLEVPEELVGNHFFATLLLNFFNWYPKEERDSPSQIAIYFRRLKISPNDSEEDLQNKLVEWNNDLLISTLVISRKNINGGFSEIKNVNGKTIYHYLLKPGDFIFFGKNEATKKLKNPVSHQLTKMTIEDKTKGDGWLDIIQFEINIVL